ncbi:MAG TPA: acyltransferase family protein, partial [Microcella sp.]|nr:acyltransferase family protein [Microcella sp.]
VSGYLITALLLHEHRRTGRIALRNFWSRRARRLLPALALVVMSSATVAALIGGDVLVGIGWQLLGAATFTSNWVAIGAGASYLDQTSPELFRHLWSLAVEEQFYLLWPLLLLALLALPLRRRMLVAAVSALAVASAVTMAIAAGDPAADGGQAASGAYLSTLTHGFGLLAGAAVALWREPLTQPRALFGRASTPLATVAIAAIVVIAATMSVDDASAYRGGMALAVAATVLAILALEKRDARAAQIADASAIRWLGERSYSLYLWHWPLWILGLALAPTVDRTGQGAWSVGLAVLAVSITLASLTYRFIEAPARRRDTLAPLTRGGPRRQAALAGTATVALALLIGGTGAAVQRAPDDSQAAAYIAAGHDALAAESTPAPSPAPDTPAGGPTASATTPPSSPPANADTGTDPGTADASSEETAGAVTERPALEPYDPRAPKPLPAGEQITAIGDSVMLAAVPALQAAFPGIAIDAEVGRQMSAAPGVLTALRDAGVLREHVVLALGTNGPFDPAVLDEVRTVIGDRQLVVVSAQAPRGWTDGVNQQLASFASVHRAVELADWRSGIAPRLELLAGDQIHPGPTGGEVYASEVRAALQRLADLPPIIEYTFERRDHPHRPV